MNEHQRETNFLRQLLRYDQSAARDELEEGIARTQRDMRCVRRAVCLMALLSTVASAALYYAPVFLTDSPENKWRFLIDLVSGLGLASLTSFVAFAGYWLAYRSELNRRKEECRQLIMNLLESRLGKTQAMPLSGLAKEEEITIHRSPSEIAGSASLPPIFQTPSKVL